MLWERQEATKTYPVDTDTGSSHLGEIILPQGHWCEQILLWNLPYSLLVSGHRPFHQPAGISLRILEVKQLVMQRHRFTNRKSGSNHRPLRLPVALGHDTPNRGLFVALGTLSQPYWDIPCLVGQH